MKKALSKKLDRRLFWVLMIVLFAILLVSRTFPYVLYGPYGFGYDMGIYKKWFDDTTTFSSIFESQISLLPSFLAYLFHSLSVPVDYLLYHAHILFSALLGVPLYLLTKEYFGRAVGALAVGLFAISYVQVLASEFYLFKAVLGAIFLLFALFYYSRKSWLFYLFAFLVAVTQLSQLLVLGVAFFVVSFVDFKKHKKFILSGYVMFLLVALLLFLLVPGQVSAAFEVLKGVFLGVVEVGRELHQSGLFIGIAQFFEHEFWLVLLALGGLIVSSKKKKGMEVLQISIVFLMAMVFWRVMFQNRFIVLMELLFIPFAAVFVVWVFRKLLNTGLKQIVSGVILVCVVAGLTFGFYKTTYPALMPQEIYAIEFINEQEDSKYVLVINSVYAPWFYGFSNKKVLSSGIFRSVFNFEEWNEYYNGSDERKVEMLLNISKKYGKLYMFEGMQDQKSDIASVSERIKKVIDINNATIYEILPPVSQPVSQ